MHNLYLMLDEYADEFEDKEIIELIKDISSLSHACELYHSNDTCRGNYQVAIDEFKNKWFSINSRKERLSRYKKQFAKEYLRIIGIYDMCENCKYFKEYDYLAYGNCDLNEYQLTHTHDCCENFVERRK